MPDPDTPDTAEARPSVFLSYASEDREAARLLRDALPAYGLQVWYDESELGGGEAWDHKIRRQIRECDYFMPVVSAQTEARHEGYFRREWRLAVERTLDMADDHPFLLPVVIDGTDQGVARVPEKFLTVQWVRAPGGRSTPALEALCRRVVSGAIKVTRVSRASPAQAGAGPMPRRPDKPEFPREEPGQKVRFWVEVGGWVFRAGWAQFMRVPRWVRILLYLWIAIAFMSRCGTSKHERPADVSPDKIQKLKTISQHYQGGIDKRDVAKLGAEIAREFSDDDDDTAVEHGPVLAIPFTAPPGDEAGRRLADSAFAMVYGMASISHRGQVSLAKTAPASHEADAVLERGRANRATYVLYGGIDRIKEGETLTVNIAAVADGSVVWSRSYPVAGADATKIAAEADSKIPVLPTP